MSPPPPRTGAARPLVLLIGLLGLVAAWCVVCAVGARVAGQLVDRANVSDIDAGRLAGRDRRGAGEGRTGRTPGDESAPPGHATSAPAPGALPPGTGAAPSGAEGSARGRAGGPGGTDDPAPDPAAGASGARPAPGTPRPGGTLRLPGEMPQTLDPAVVGDVSSAVYIYEIYSGLVTLSDRLEVVPDLAESWEVDASGTSYTFTLRSGAVFHDGSPVRAADVVYAIERACDPATDSPVAATYLGDVIGCADKIAGRADRVSGAGAPDDRRVVLKIDAPKAYFLSKLTYPTSFVVDRRQVERDPSWSLHPNATGPFRLAAFEPDELLRLERHDGHYGGRALLDAVEFDLRPIDPLTRYENGELDASPVGPADVERVTDPLNPLSAEVMVGSGDLGLTYLGFHVGRPPFDDVHVRRAFARAIDKQRLADVVLNGAVRPLDTILPPGMPGHDPNLHPWPYDPEAAREELAASRYGGPRGFPPVTIDVPGEVGGGGGTAEAIADLVGETLGISVTVEQTPWPTYQRELDQRAYDVFMLGWSADYPDPQDFLDVLFHGDSPLNHTAYADAEVDAMLEAARTETDTERRLEIYREAERRILDDAAWVPIDTGVETWLVASHVHGFTLPAIVLPRMARVWLSEP